MKKTEIAAIVIILAIAALAWLGGKQFGHKSSEPGGNALKPAKEARVVKDDTAKILAAFPAGFPVEAGAQNTGAYTYIPANSVEQQSTLEYTSQKSVAENGKIYRDYLATAGFKITNKSEAADLVFYYATKGSEVLSIMIKKTDGQVTVSASVLKR